MNDNQKLEKHQVVIIGGGFGGLYAAKSLKNADVQVTIVDKRNFHLFQPFLYQVATGGLSPEDIAAPLRSILSDQKNVKILKAEVVGFEPQNHKVLLRDGELQYDSLIIAAGMQTHYFNQPEWQQRALGLKTIEDALEIRRRIFLAFEAAEWTDNQKVQENLMTFLVVGGGPTGVELAGALAELTKETLRGEFRNIDTADAKVILVEALDHILPSYPKKSSEQAVRALERKGVQVRTGAMVKQIKDDYVLLDENGQDVKVNTCTVLWAAGMKGVGLVQDLAQISGAEMDRQGRIIVKPDLTLPNHPEIFVIGDLARVKDQNGDPLPGVAQVAMQQGRYAAQIIEARLQGRTKEPFVYLDRGLLSVIGRNSAVASIRGVHFNGFAAWVVWVFVHIWFLIEFNNKLSVMIQWMWNYFTWDRGARLITGEDPYSLIETGD